MPFWVMAMRCEVKRVPLDFGWPLNKVWEGYLMPDSLKEGACPAGVACEYGHTLARAWVEEIAHLALILDDDLHEQRCGNDLHPYFHSVPGGGTYGLRPRPSADIREFGTGLAGCEAMFKHDVEDRRRATKRLIEAAGLDPDTWGICPMCKGYGGVEAYPGQRAEAEAWVRSEPPAGEGWQLWEIVSEGSPVSPVFATGDELARWLTTPEGGAAVDPSRQPMRIGQAREFVGVGGAPSGSMADDRARDDASYIGSEASAGDLFDHCEPEHRVAVVWDSDDSSALDAAPVDAAESSRMTVGAFAAAVDEDPKVTELIFESVSAWFEEQRRVSTEAASRDEIDETATPSIGFSVPISPFSAALDWRSAGDHGWRAANALHESTDYEITAAGLPKRRPKAHLMPGSAGPSRVEPTPSSDGLIRSPTEVRVRLSSYQRGLRRGRHSRDNAV